MHSCGFGSDSGQEGLYTHYGQHHQHWKQYRLAHDDWKAQTIALEVAAARGEAVVADVDEPSYDSASQHADDQQRTRRCSRELAQGAVQSESAAVKLRAALGSLDVRVVGENPPYIAAALVTRPASHRKPKRTDETLPLFNCNLSLARQLLRVASSHNLIVAQPFTQEYPFPSALTYILILLPFYLPCALSRVLPSIHCRRNRRQLRTDFILNARHRRDQQPASHLDTGLLFQQTIAHLSVLLSAIPQQWSMSHSSQLLPILLNFQIDIDLRERTQTSTDVSPPRASPFPVPLHRLLQTLLELHFLRPPQPSELPRIDSISHVIKGTITNVLYPFVFICSIHAEVYKEFPSKIDVADFIR